MTDVSALRSAAPAAFFPLAEASPFSWLSLEVRVRVSCLSCDGCISVQRYWSSLLRYCPRDSVFVGDRSSSPSNLGIPLPALLSYTWDWLVNRCKRLARRGAGGLLSLSRSLAVHSSGGAVCARGHSARDGGDAVDELGLEEHVGVVEHAFLERHHQELQNISIYGEAGSTGSQWSKVSLGRRLVGLTRSINLSIYLYKVRCTCDCMKWDLIINKYACMYVCIYL